MLARARDAHDPVAPAGTSRVTTAPARDDGALAEHHARQQDRAGPDTAPGLDRRPDQPLARRAARCGALSLAIATIVETNAPSPIVVRPVTCVLSMIFTSSPTVTS